MRPQASDELAARLRRINTLAGFLFMIFIAAAALGIAAGAGFMNML